MSRTYLAIPHPGDAIADPEKWNNDWEGFLRRPILTPEFCFRNMVKESEMQDLDRTLDGYPVLLGGTCAVQRNLTEDALLSFSTRDLEARWLAASPDVRRKHIIGALAAVCSKSQNLNKARAYCAPELRLSRLRLSGTVFLDLLRSAMLDDASFIPRTPKYVSHPKWDEFAAVQGARNRTEFEKVSLAEVLVLRTKLICHVLHFTLRSFFGLEYPTLIVQKEHKSHMKAKDPGDVDHKQIQREIFGTDAFKARRKLEVASAKERISQRLGICSYLGCYHHEPADGSVKYARCEQCFVNLQRQVLYCSPECQEADWKLRHRAVCGRPLAFEDVSTLPEHPANLARRAAV